MKFLEKLQKRIRDYDASRGYSCDSCGKELFNYPTVRVCSACEGKLKANDGNVCPKCGRKTLSNGICLTCKRRMPSFHRGFSPFVYIENVAALVNRMKNGRPRIAHYFGEKMADDFLQSYARKELFSLERGELEFLLIPVPLTKAKRWERGYNQAEFLAWGVERRLTQRGYRATVKGDILIKSKDAKQQKHLHYKERFENAADSYSVVKRKECKNRTILLIDDVLTTGATSGECARKLLSAGAAEVLFLCAAALSEQK